MTKRSAIFTQIAGQDDTCLARHLLSFEYAMDSTFRLVSSKNFWRLTEFGLQNYFNFHMDMK